MELLIPGVSGDIGSFCDATTTSVRPASDDRHNERQRKRADVCGGRNHRLCSSAILNHCLTGYVLGPVHSSIRGLVICGAERQTLTRIIVAAKMPRSQKIVDLRLRQQLYAAQNTHRAEQCSLQTFPPAFRGAMPFSGGLRGLGMRHSRNPSVPEPR